MRDFEDTVPVDMDDFRSLPCEECGQSWDVSEVEFGGYLGEVWRCPNCGCVNDDYGISV